MLESRKLASVRKISSIAPIEGADNIEKITIDGWSCVAKKGEFKEGDLCVYFEIDSFLPICPEFEFLRKTSYRKMGDIEGFRLKTIKLRGVLSQGLALPLDILSNKKIDVVTDDLADILGVIKYELPIPAQLAGIAKSNFPSFIHKTDQQRVQNIWDDIKDSEEDFEVTEKLDGTSCTYYLYNGNFGVCSRNLELEFNENNTLWKLAKQYDIEKLLRAYGKNIALQGEVIGEGIQKNPHDIKGQDFYLFDIWDIEQQCYLLPDSRRLIRNTFFKNLKHVFILKDYHDLLRYTGIEELLASADINPINNKPMEGIVFKSNHRQFSFKVISNSYLLENE